MPYSDAHSTLSEHPSSPTPTLGTQKFSVFNYGPEVATCPVQTTPKAGSPAANKENVPFYSATSSSMSAGKKKKGLVVHKGGISKARAPLAMKVVRKSNFSEHLTKMVRETQGGLDGDTAKKLLGYNQRAKELTELPLREISEGYGIQPRVPDHK